MTATYALCLISQVSYMSGTHVFFTAFSGIFPSLHAPLTRVPAEGPPLAALWAAAIWTLPQEYWADAGAGSHLLEN